MIHNLSSVKSSCTYIDLLGIVAYLQKELISNICPSIRMSACISSVPTGWICVLAWSDTRLLGELRRYKH